MKIKQNLLFLQSSEGCTNVTYNTYKKLIIKCLMTSDLQSLTRLLRHTWSLLTPCPIGDRGSYKTQDHTHSMQSSDPPTSHPSNLVPLFSSRRREAEQRELLRSERHANTTRAFRSPVCYVTQLRHRLPCGYPPVMAQRLC